MGIFGNIFAGRKNKPPAVCDLELGRYLGTWYEIARMPQAFENGLDNVTATYSLMEDGRIRVVNAGTREGKRQEARAVAWVPDSSCTGELFVSFFRPFRSRYRVILLDKEKYSYAVVAGGSVNYFWILSREPWMSEELYSKIISFASSKGIDTGRIVRVKQEKRL
jgi:apolipoprotein D and lipocalin family protein